MTRKAYMLTLMALSTIAVLYFSWLPNPNIGLQPYFPKAVGRWINDNWNLRTAIPFVFLAAVAEIGFVHITREVHKRLWIVAGLLGLVTLAELGQLFLADRHFDFGDILWGFWGTLTGLIAGYLIKPILNK